MVMSGIWTFFVALSILCAVITGQADALGKAVMEGAQSGISLSVSMAGSICLWSGVGKLMQKTGITGTLARLLRPVIGRIFPSSITDPELSGDLSANICANILGLGNAATPMGIRAARRLKQGDVATDELCRLVVLNTASIQLIPTNVAAVRSALGSSRPFSILPAVWISSFFSAGLGLTCAWLMGRLLRK